MTMSNGRNLCTINQQLEFLLFQNIQNVKAIREMILEDKLPAAMVNPAYVWHPDQLLFASHKSVHSLVNSKLKTRSVYTEILYNLSPSRNIKDALKTFGLQADNNSLSISSAIFVVFSKEAATHITELVEGEHLEDIAKVNDLEGIKKLYKVPGDLTQSGDILNCILTRMATKDLL